MAQPTLDTFQVIADPSRREMLRAALAGQLNHQQPGREFRHEPACGFKAYKNIACRGVIAIQDIGRERHCTLKQDGFNELQKWLAYFDQFWASKLKKLETLLNNKLPIKPG